MCVCVCVCAAMNCQPGTVTGSVASGASLTGVTDGTVVATCAYGYSFGGLASSKTFTCTGTGNAANAWSPATDATDNQCLGA